MQNEYLKVSSDPFRHETLARILLLKYKIKSAHIRAINYENFASSPPFYTFFDAGIMVYVL